MTDRLTGNLLEPLIFDDGEVDKFIQRHRCAECQGWLIKLPTEDRRWTVKCLTHGPILAHNYIHIAAVERMVSNNLAAQRDLR